MEISEKKMQIVINNYFKQECDVNTSIREAFEKGFRIGAKKASSAQPEIIRCKDCKHFEYDHVENVNGIPLIVAHEICTRWSDGVKTSENGYCFLAESREVSE